MTIKQLKQKLPTIKEIIGWKEFPEEKDKLLIQAFIRRSYSQEHPGIVNISSVPKYLKFI